MFNTNTGGPAFPVSRYVNADGETFDSSIQGMTLRDYFAAKAMQVFLASEKSTMTDDAVAAYEMADAMLKVRKL